MASIYDYSQTPGSNTALAPENMAPSAVNDAIRQVQADIAGGLLEVYTTGGAADAYTVTLSPAVSSYTTTADLRFTAKIHTANLTTTPTINLNGLGAKTIVDRSGSAVVAGAFPTGCVASFWYDGTNMRAVDIAGGALSGTSLTLSADLSVQGNTTLGNAATDTVTVTADVASHLIPSADDTYDLGGASDEWRNLYIDGTANIDSLVADTADINAGTFDGVVGGTTPAAGTFTTLNASGGGALTGTWTNLGSVTTVDLNGGTIDGMTIGGAVAPTVTNLGSVTTCDINGGTIDGVTIGASVAPTVTNLGTVTTCDINGGTIDGAVIGGSSPAAITGTTITATGNVTGANLSGTNTGDQTSIVGISGTIAQFNTACSDADFATGGGTATGTNTGDQTTISGNAGSATVLQTARNINGVSFNGSADITITAAAGTLTGTTLAAGVTASSLTSLGTIASLVATSADINGGTVDGAVIGGASAAAITGTTVTASTQFTGPGLGITSPENAQTGTTYTLAASDAGKVVTCSNGSAITVTVNSSVFSTGQVVMIAQKGAGQVTISAGTATLRSRGSALKTYGQYSVVTLWFISASEAYVFGDVTT